MTSSRCACPTAAVYAKPRDHFCGDELNELINAMADPREPGTCRYSPSHLAWLATLLFGCRMKSREELDRQRRHPGFAASVSWLAGTA